MLVQVSRDVIDMRVVREWARLMRRTAEERGHDVSMVQAMPPCSQTFSEVLEAVRRKPDDPEYYRGLEFYRRMIPFCPGYEFETGVKDARV